MEERWFKEVRGCRGVSDTCWRVVHFFFRTWSRFGVVVQGFQPGDAQFGFCVAVGGGCALLASDGPVMAAH